MLTQDIHDSLARDLNKRYGHVLSVRCDYTLRLLQGEHKHVKKWLSNREVIESALPLLTDKPPATPVTHILFTIHRELHWVLAILDLKKKQFTHLDSMNGGQPENDQAKEELHTLKTHLNLAGDASIPWAPDSFPDVPQQVGGVDCGIFTLAWSTCIGLGVDPAEVKQEHMSNLRQRFLLRLLLPAEDDAT
jgi:Ulp1 family protease